MKTLVKDHELKIYPSPSGYYVGECECSNPDGFGEGAEMFDGTRQDIEDWHWDHKLERGLV